MAEVGEYQNELVIIGDWEISYSKPENYRTYWPTGVFAKDFAHLIGKVARRWSPGVYEVDGINVCLKNGSETTPIYSETRPIKPPRGKKEWSYGKWR